MAIPNRLRRKLWAHQIEALNFATPLLRDPASKQKVALLRLPTGTGKTGIVATLAVADAPEKWTLVLTPWANLCQQMMEDLKAGFWKGVEWNPPAIPKIRRLLPSNVTKQLSEKTRLVLVATFATLTDLRNKHRAEYDQLAGKLGEVIVDEGHYEPAAEWGQAVKGLGAPTLILTATPYRNDLKLFRVPGENVFHFTHEEAEKMEIIRKLTVRKIGANEPHGGVADS